MATKRIGLTKAQLKRRRVKQRRDDAAALKLYDSLAEQAKRHKLERGPTRRERREEIRRLRQLARTNSGHPALAK